MLSNPILLISPKGREEETIIRLSRVGFDNTLGYLNGGFEAWKKAGFEYDTILSIHSDELKIKIEKEHVPVFDVRKEGEFKSEHIIGALHTPLDFLNDHLHEFPENKTFYLHCAGGYRSAIAASILKSRGIHNFVDVTDGFGSIKKSGIPVTNYVCPTTL